MNLIFIGFKYCGKTTLGKLIAKQFGYKFIDTDALIKTGYLKQKKQKLKISEIYQLEGEHYFRLLEKKIITELNPLQNTVIATGGGSILHPENQIHLKKLGKIFYLQLSFEKLFLRLKKHSLPEFLKNERKSNSNNDFYAQNDSVDVDTVVNKFFNLYHQRKPIYQQLADFIVDVNDKSVEQAIDDINKLIERINHIN